MPATPTPNMGLVLPVVGSTIGPIWANELNAALDVVDLHDHSPGNGKPITTAAIDIDADLSMVGFSLTDAARINLVSTGAVTSLPISIYSVGGDLFYNNSSGVPVQITNGSGVVGSPGSIDNMLPGVSVYWDNTANAFLFKQTPTLRAGLDAAALLLRASSLGAGNAVKLQAAAASADWTLTLPDAAGSAAGSLLSVNSSGASVFWTLDSANTIDLNGTVVRVKPLGITAARLATDAVETIKIKNLNVSAAKLATDAVETAKIKDLNVTLAKIETALKDGTAATTSLRSLGTGALQACAGNDARLSDNRNPIGTAGGSLTGSYPNPSIGANSVGVNQLIDGQVTPVKREKRFGYGRMTNQLNNNLSGAGWTLLPSTTFQTIQLDNDRPFYISFQPNSGGTSSEFTVENRDGFGVSKYFRTKLNLKNSVGTLLRSWHTLYWIKGGGARSFDVLTYQDVTGANVGCYIDFEMYGDGTAIWLNALTEYYWIISQ